MVRLVVGAGAETIIASPLLPGKAPCLWHFVMSVGASQSPRSAKWGVSSYQRGLFTPLAALLDRRQPSRGSATITTSPPAQPLSKAWLIQAWARRGSSRRLQPCVARSAHAIWAIWSRGMNLTSLTRCRLAPGTYTDITCFPGVQRPTMIGIVARDKARQSATKCDTLQENLDGPEDGNGGCSGCFK